MRRLNGLVLARLGRALAGMLLALLAPVAALASGAASDCYRIWMPADGGPDGRVGALVYLHG